MTAPVILLVDDEPSALTSLCAMLERENGYRVATATKAAEGLALARTLAPDLIISDYDMPGMDGFEFCRRIRADPALSETSFLVLSGHRDSGLTVAGLDLGADDFLLKPIEPAVFRARVRAALRGKRAQDRLRAEEAEARRLHAALEASFEKLVRTLIGQIDLTLPGAGARGRRLAELTRLLGERFNLAPDLHRDLELAALLHQVGQTRDGIEAGPRAGRAGERDDVGLAWTLLEPVEPLRPAAELIDASLENWDGSGEPRGRVAGEIPLCSRLLRIGIDFLALVEGRRGSPSLTPAMAISQLELHEAIRYDPLVLAHLRSSIVGVAAERAASE